MRPYNAAAMLLCRIISFIALGILFSQALTAQDYEIKTQLSRRDANLFEEATQNVNRQNFTAAEALLTRILERNPVNVDVWLARGSVREYRRELAGAESDYEKAIALAPERDETVYFAVAEVEQQQAKYAEAANHYRDFLSRSGPSDRLRERAKRQLVHAETADRLYSNPVPFNPERLSDAINTPHWEYFPSLSADGHTMVFTRQERRNEDFYISYFEEEVGWTPAEPIRAINTPGNEGAQTLSADGKVLIFTACDRPDGYGSCDLYESKLIDGRWTEPINIGPNVNSKAKETQPSLSGNGRLLFFASDRPGGIGGGDLWASARQRNGQWGPPLNLGPVVNTETNEGFPFFHADGRTLYFSSDGHPGLGEDDLFYTRLDDQQIWGTPVNLGYPINTSNTENSLVVTLDGKRAYFASDRTESGRSRTTDIFVFDLNEANRPGPVTYVQATVTDATTGERIDAQVEVFDLATEQPIFSQRTGPDGSFLAVLPSGKTYSLAVDQEAYLFYSDQFDLSGTFSQRDPYRLEIELQPVSMAIDSEPIVLKNVLFETGSATLLDVSLAELNRLFRLLMDYPELRIQINGHTDNVGSEVDNKLLSEQRAAAVYDFLVAQGVAEDRLTYRGFGESEPIDTNDTPAGRARNRRTEFQVVEEQ